MIELNRYIISFNFHNNLTKVEDLIYYDGPILSHFTDSNGDDYLFYWVDYNDRYNRWIIWNVKKSDIISYLEKSKSLYELINHNSTFFFVLDADYNQNDYISYLIPRGELPKEYIPQESSYYPVELPNVYKEYFNKDYVLALRDRSYNFKISPSERSFGTTVSLKDASIFLNNIMQSFENYSTYDFYAKFRETIPDFARLKKAVQNIKTIIQPRICDVAYGSFEVSLAIDNIRNLEIAKKYISWKNDILDSYKNNVIDYDFNDEEDLQIIIQKFPDEDVRAKIFNPILQIVENDHINFKVNKKDHSFEREFKHIDKEVKERIIPPKEKGKEKNDKKKLINIVVEVPEDGDVSSLTKKALTDGLLFSQETQEFPIIVKEFTLDSYHILLDNPLTLQIRLEDEGHYYLEYKELDISTILKDKEGIKRQFFTYLINRYFDYNEKGEKSPYYKFFKSNLITVTPIS